MTKSSTGSSADLDLVVEEDKDHHQKGVVHSIFHKNHDNLQFVVDIEEMKTIHYPSQCISDYNFIKGFCPTPKYLKPKPKKH